MKDRIWIIGNGPSLAHTPLDYLIGEDTFAMNRVHLIYPYTRWRPKYYLLVDYSPLSGNLWKDCVYTHLEMGIPMWLLDIFEKGFPPGDPNYEDLPEGLGKLPNATYVSRCKRHHFYHAPNSKGAQLWHLPELCTGYSTIGLMMQIAVQMGYKEIYLLGCDLGYVADNTKNHFDPGYNTHDPRDLSDQQNNDTLMAHIVARRSCPIPIYNATLGGHLEVHPRVDMLEVLNGENRREAASDPHDHRGGRDHVGDGRETIPVGKKRRVSTKRSRRGGGAES